MDPIVLLNGRLLHADRVRIDPADVGFLLGDGLFETMRIYNGRILDLDRHLARLGRSAAVFRLTLPPAADLTRQLGRLVERNGRRTGRCRLTVTRGRLQGRLGFPQSMSGTVVAFTAPLGFRTANRKPVVLVSASVRLDEKSPLAGHKATSYLPFLWAREEAAARGADEAVIVNTAGRVAECAAANIFAVRGGAVTTPPLASGCLPGIVRGVVLELCHALGIPRAERSLRLVDLQQADEAFITSSIRELVPVASVDGRMIPHPGAITAVLHKAYVARAKRLTGRKPA